MKFKNAKKKKSASGGSLSFRAPKKQEKEILESPKNSRSIPDGSHFLGKPRFWIGIVTLFFVLCFIGAVFLLVMQIRLYEASLRQRAIVSSRLAQWERVIAQHPDYRDGYVQAGVLAYQLQDNHKALSYIEKALVLDPTYLPARKMLGIL